MNLISKYMNYKLMRLKNYASIILSNETNRLSDDCLNRFLSVYIKTYYYHVLGTVDYNDDIIFDNDIINKELNGMELEILDEVGNKNRDEVSKYKNIVKFIIRIDQLKFRNRDEIEDSVADVINNSDITVSKGKLVNLVKNTYSRELRFFKEFDNISFKLNYYLYKNKTDKYYLGLTYNIKQIENNYNKNLVNKIYNSAFISNDKLMLMIQKFSMDILVKTLNQENMDTYFIDLWDDVFKNKKTYESIFKLLDNKVIQDHIVLNITYNTYLNNKDIIKKYMDKFKFSCSQDLTHINDITTKLTNLEGLNIFDYIVITNCKSKDLEEVQKYEPTIISEILFSDGV